MTNPIMRRKKKIGLAWLLAAAMVWAMLPTPVLRASTSNLSISVASQSITIPSPNDSATADFTVNLHNISNALISNIRITATGANTGFASVASLSADGMTSVQVPIMVSGSGGTRTDAIQFTVQYTLGGVDDVVVQWATLNIFVTPAPTVAPTPTPQPDPNIHLLTPQIVTVEAGEVREVELTLRNNGIGSANEVLTSVNSGGAAPFIVEIVENIRISTIPENQERTITLRITVDENATPGVTNYPVGLSHSFRTTARQNSSSSNVLQVRIGGEIEPTPTPTPSPTPTPTPNVRLSNPRSNIPMPLAPGQEFTVFLDMHNMGNASATDVQITVGGMGTTAFLPITDLNQFIYASMAVDQRSAARIMFQASPQIAAGLHELVFTVSYKDIYGENPRTHAVSLFITIEAPEAPVTNLEVRGITSPSGIISSEETAAFSLELYNSGETELYAIQVSANPPTGIDPMSQAIRTISALPPGESVLVEFSFSPRQNAGNHSHTIGFTINYQIRDSDEAPPPIPVFAAMAVYNPPEEDDDDDDEDESQRPWVIIDNFFIDPSVANAGQTFTMTVTFRNSSSIHPVNNARITFTPLAAETAQGAVFIPTGGSSNTLFIDHIPPGGTVTEELNFFTVNDAAPRSYTIKVDSTYQSPGFPTLTADENLSVQVIQRSRLWMSDFWLPNSVTVGQTIMAEFSAENRGLAMVQNATVRIESSVEGVVDTLYLGHLQPGRWLMYRGQFSLSVPGPATVSVVLFGEDNAGEIVEHSVSFEIFVDDFGGGDRSDMWEDPTWNPGFEYPWNPGFDDPWGPQEPEKLSWWRRLWNWLTRPLGGYAGVRRNSGGADPMNDMFWPQDDFWNYENEGRGGIELMRTVVTVPSGGGGVVVSPGGGRTVVGRPMQPGGDFDMWDDMEQEGDSFFIHLWNFVRMPIFLLPFGMGLGALITVLVLKKKRKSALDFEDLDE